MAAREFGGAAQAKKLDDPLPLLNEAIRLAPDASRYYVSRAQYFVLAATKDKDGETVAATPDFEKAMLDKAIADCDKAIRLDPSFAHAYHLRGNARLIREDFDGAIADFEKATSLKSSFKSPPITEILLMRADSRAEKGDLKGALADIDRALKAEPKNVYALGSRSEVWIKLKKFDRADADLKESLRLEPANEVCLAGRSRFLSACPDAKYRNGAEALELAKKLKGSSEESIAAAYAEMGEFEKAVHWQQKAMLDRSVAKEPDAQRRLQLYKAKRPYRLD
ncbi:MAG TPA: tetratricopeptide repeat protein [Gemmataceae bacterium]|nr:tetratricopeptide repeat protein [Gemmataceae bacterium]